MWCPACSCCECRGTASSTGSATPAALGTTGVLGSAEAITPSPVTRAPPPCRLTRTWYATTGRLATNVSTATSPSSSPWPGTEVRGSPCSDQRPMTYHLVRRPCAVLALTSISIQEPGGVRAVHDGTIWVAAKPI